MNPEAANRPQSHECSRYPKTSKTLRHIALTIQTYLDGMSPFSHMPPRMYLVNPQYTRPCVTPSFIHSELNLTYRPYHDRAMSRPLTFARFPLSTIPLGSGTFDLVSLYRVPLSDLHVHATHGPQRESAATRGAYHVARSCTAMILNTYVRTVFPSVSISGLAHVHLMKLVDPSFSPGDSYSYLFTGISITMPSVSGGS
jgi:hypothetical protein